ncbi:MAG TPA: hypothetical protein VGQ31_14170 [Candidatus Limnocylindrales bacterium]|nr:hypothetical protein [Candidatus Limnocylindrales bacterium]
MPPDTASRRRVRYRRFVIVFSIIGGVALGVGVGSIAALADAWTLVLLLVVPLGLRVIGRASGRFQSVDPAVWLWPAVGLPVACATFILMPSDAAPIGAGLAVATWFVLIVVGGVLEVVLDPDGGIAGSTD